MAKDTKKQETANVAATSEENVMDVIKTGNLLKESNVAAALAEIEKEKDEKQKQEAKEMICVAQYNNLKALLQLRARRREERATKEFLSKTKEVLDQVLAGKLTPNEYKAKKNELEEQKRKACTESDAELRKESIELQNSYEGRYRYYWD